MVLFLVIPWVTAIVITPRPDALTAAAHLGVLHLTSEMPHTESRLLGADIQISPAAAESITV